jgi:hypothetical protein
MKGPSNVTGIQKGPNTTIDFRLRLALECQAMSKDWIGKMFGEQESQESRAAKKLEEELLKQKRITELAPIIWGEIESILKETIAAFNQKSSLLINIDPYSQPYTLEANTANYQYGWIVKFDIASGTISYGNPLTEFTHGNLMVKIDDESHYTFHDPRNPKEPVSLEDIDEVLLKGFVRLVLKESSKSERTSSSPADV